MADPYATLGIARTATEKDIKSAYRKLAKELHPDRNKDNPKAAERFSVVTQAYDLLSDKDKRAQFDRGEIDGDGNPAMPFGYGQGGGGGNPFGNGGGGFGGFRAGAGPGGFDAEGIDLGDIFDGLFSQRGGGFGGGGFGGRHQGPPPRGANVQYRLKVGFVDAATRADQRITLSDGKTIDLKLPAGVENGTQMRLSGKGDAGPGGAGDAIISIEVGSHPFYIRDGDNIRLDLPVTLNEALAGAKVRVPTVDGPVTLTVPAGTRSGQVLRLKGRGWPRKDGTRGDQFVTLMIDLPTDDADLRQRLEGWQDSRNIRERLGT